MKPDLKSYSEEVSFSFKGKTYSSLKPLVLMVLKTHHEFNAQVRRKIPLGVMLGVKGAEKSPYGLYSPVRLRKPLVISRGLYKGIDTWPLFLSNLTGESWGPQITRALVRMRYDSVVVEFKRKPFLILNLTEEIPSLEKEMDKEVAAETLRKTFPEKVVKNPIPLKELGEKFFSEKVDPEDLGALFGSKGFPKVSVIVQESNVYISSPLIEDMSRTLFIDKNGKKYVSNNSLFLSPGNPPGTGAKMLYGQMLAGRKLGISYLSTHANKALTRNPEQQIKYYEDQILKLKERLRGLKDPLERGGLLEELREMKSQLGLFQLRDTVGYYVWPRLGYNTSLRKALESSAADIHFNSASNHHPLSGKGPKEIFKSLLQKRLLPREATFEESTLQDLMRTSGGRKWLSTRLE